MGTIQTVKKCVTSNIWALTLEKVSSGFANNKCTDQPAQIDQRLLVSLIGEYHIETCYERNFKKISVLITSARSEGACESALAYIKCECR